MINYFTDPVLKAPTIGSMLMCFIAAFVGTFSVLKKRSLVGEAISHASYPGVICSLLLGQMFFEGQWWQELLIPLIGAAMLEPPWYVFYPKAHYKISGCIR